MEQLLSRWRALHPQADSSDRSGAVDAWGRELIALWQQPHRRYHDVRHLTEVLDRVDVLAHHARDADAVRLAAFTHDAVYDPRAPAGANEAASGDIAREVLSDLAHPAVREVVRLVQLTATHDAGDDDPDGQVLCDADLGVLAADAERYVPAHSGSPSCIRSATPWLNTASASPSTCATLTAGRVARCRALAADPLVPKLHVPCTKCPSSALIRGSPRAVVVATVMTFMPVKRATRSVAVSAVSAPTIERRCSVESACEASSRRCSALISSGVSCTVAG